MARKDQSDVGAGSDEVGFQKSGNVHQLSVVGQVPVRNQNGRDIRMRLADLLEPGDRVFVFFPIVGNA